MYPIITIGLNVVISKDADAYVVTHHKAWNNRVHVATCSNYQDAEAIARDVQQ